MKHVMIDIETMGTRPYSAIISIAAVRFNLNTGRTGESFYMPVSLASCIDSGLTVDGATIMWWMGQNDKAREVLICNSQDLI